MSSKITQEYSTQSRLI